MPRLRYTEEATADLAEIAAFVAEQNGSRNAGRRLAGQLRRRCAELAARPGTMGRPRGELAPELRSAVFKSYVIFFRYAGGFFKVVNILECHHDLQAHFSAEQ